MFCCFILWSEHLELFWFTFMLFGSHSNFFHYGCSGMSTWTKISVTRTISTGLFISLRFFGCINISSYIVWLWISRPMWPLFCLSYNLYFLRRNLYVQVHLYLNTWENLLVQTHLVAFNFGTGLAWHSSGTKLDSPFVSHLFIFLLSKMKGSKSSKLRVAWQGLKIFSLSV